MERRIILTKKTAMKETITMSVYKQGMYRVEIRNVESQNRVAIEYVELTDDDLNVRANFDMIVAEHFNTAVSFDYQMSHPNHRDGGRPYETYISSFKRLQPSVTF